MPQFIKIGRLGGLGGALSPAAGGGGAAAAVVDDFNRANTSAGDLGTASGGFTYTRIGGDVGGQVLSNTFYGANGDASRFRANHDLGSANMYSQLVSTGYDGTGGGDADVVPLARVSNSADTAYAALLRHARTPDDWSYTLQRRINGSPTNFASTTENFTSFPATVRLECNGSTIRFLRDGVQKLSTTDTNIPGNTRPGVATFGGLGRFADDFEADVL